MDFVRLGPVYTSSYTPDLLLEKWNSLIWTERFGVPGEFELSSYAVDEMRTLLPIDTLVSHLETDQVMMVDTHSISMEGEGADAQPVIKVTGKTLDAFLEHRFVEGVYQAKRQMRRAYSPVSAAAVLLYNAFDNASGKDVTRGSMPTEDDVGLWVPGDPPVPTWPNDFAWTTLDRIPNICITDSAAADGTSRRWWLKEGMLLPQLTPILDAGRLGIRVIRPSRESTAAIVTVVVNPIAQRGTVVRTNTGGITSMRFDIYQGVDRRNDVQLSLLHGHIDNPEYLWSNRDFKTVVETMSTMTVSDVARNGTEAGYSGLRRRVDAVDAGSPELPPAPPRPDELGKGATKPQKERREEAVDRWIKRRNKWNIAVDNIIAEFKEDAETDAKTALNQARFVSMFSGDMSDLSPYKYKTHYDLGDTITLNGDYGLKAAMVVREYVRTEDENGDRGFPGLTLP